MQCACTRLKFLRKSWRFRHELLNSHFLRNKNTRLKKLYSAFRDIIGYTRTKFDWAKPVFEPWPPFVLFLWSCALKLILQLIQSEFSGFKSCPGMTFTVFFSLSATCTTSPPFGAIWGRDRVELVRGRQPSVCNERTILKEARGKIVRQFLSGVLKIFKQIRGMIGYFQWANWQKRLSHCLALFVGNSCDF